MDKTKEEYRAEGMIAQHTTVERFRKRFDPEIYDVIESEGGSDRDCLDKVDITVINKITGEIREYDVKSSKKDEDSDTDVSYTYQNGNNEKSLIFKKQFHVDLIYTFDDNDIAYIVSAADFYKILLDRIRNNMSKPGKFNQNSRYIMVSRQEIIDMAYDTF